VRVDALVTDEVLRRHAASGTPAQMRAAFAGYQQAGLDEIVIAGVTDGPALQRILAAAEIGG